MRKIKTWKNFQFSDNKIFEIPGNESFTGSLERDWNFLWHIELMQRKKIMLRRQRDKIRYIRGELLNKGDPDNIQKITDIISVYD